MLWRNKINKREKDRFQRDKRKGKEPNRRGPKSGEKEQEW